MFKTIARFTTRPSGTGSTKPDIGLICFFKDNDAIKANHVYEIKEIMGELRIIDLGEGAMSGETPEKRYGLPSWSQCIGDILMMGGGRIILTKAELEYERLKNTWKEKWPFKKEKDKINK
jgi:hypothetical protein